MPAACPPGEHSWRDPALERQPVLLARSHAAAPSGSRLPDGTVRGRDARSPPAAARSEAPTLIRVERHAYGPRVYVLGQRIHEFALGGAVLAVVGAVLLLHLARVTNELALVAGGGAWLVLKDWRDLFPRRRNTSIHSRFAVHRPAGMTLARRPGLPLLAALATLVVAVVNAASALTPNVAWRGRLLLQVEPISALPIFHAIALPASVALGLTALYLHRRRRRALLLAIGLLLVLGVADELKGLDFEEAALSGALALALFRGRRAFDVEHEPLALRASVVPLAWCGLALTVAGAVSVWLAGRTDPSVGLAAREAAALLSWQSGPISLDDAGAPDLVHALVLAALVAASWVLFRPRRPDALTGAAERRRARELVRTYGRDTLATFKLRDDLEYLFSSDRRAFLGYRLAGRVLLVAGDPVGPDDALPALIAEARSYAAAHGLRLGAVGASEAAARRWRQAGLRSLYLGDEAIVDASAFSLAGRPIRKVRQSVSRLSAAGYTASVAAVEGLCADTVAELEEISAQWRGAEPERGFAMSIGSLSDGPAREGVVVVARDREGRTRGWLHFLPSYGRPAMSLALMRREHDTPNGLMEFLVVQAIELLRARGVEELSLNFATFARPLRSPRGRLDLAAARLLGVASRWFQIESLYRFNAKFFPRWEPRYLLYQGPAALPRVGLAALIAEGQLPRALMALFRAGAASA